MTAMHRKVAKSHLVISLADFQSICRPQVGASNELPESEELDALYDRFLLRRSVSQVSSSQLGNLARLAAGTRLVAEPHSNGASGNGAATPLADPQEGSGLDLEDFRYMATPLTWSPLNHVHLFLLMLPQNKLVPVGLPSLLPHPPPSSLLLRYNELSFTLSATSPNMPCVWHRV